MTIPTGKLIAIGGSEDKGTDLESGHIHRNNLNFFELAILRRIVEESGGPLGVINRRILRRQSRPIMTSRATLLSKLNVLPMFEQRF